MCIKLYVDANKHRTSTLYNMSFTVLDKNSRNIHKNIIMFLKADNYRHTLLIQKCMFFVYKAYDLS
ncbi:hypothetical protein D5266_09025 [bacterium c-19]|nr:hypothetical protein [bacterium c-19]